MKRPRTSFLALSLAAALLSSPAVGTYAQAICCARSEGCAIVAACPADETCPMGTTCGGGGCAADEACATESAEPCATDPSESCANESAPVPCAPDPERCPLLQNAPVEPVRNRVADAPGNDVHAIALAASAFFVEAPARLAVADVHAARAPAVPRFLLLRRLLI
jgi:hypothetical protein